MLKNMAIGLRLALSFGLLTLLVAIIAGAGIYQMSQINEKYNEIANVNTPEKELALRLRSASARHVAAREPGELRFQLDPKERI